MRCPEIVLTPTAGHREAGGDTGRSAGRSSKGEARLEGGLGEVMEFLFEKGVADSTRRTYASA